MKIPLQIYDIDNIDEWRDEFSYPLKKSEIDSLIAEQIRALIPNISELFRQEEKHIFRVATKRLYLEIYNLYSKLILAEKFNELGIQYDKNKSFSPIMLAEGRFDEYKFPLFEMQSLEVKSLRNTAMKVKQGIRDLLIPLKTKERDLLLCGWNDITVKIAESFDQEPLLLGERHFMPKKFKGTNIGDRESSIAVKTAGLVANSFFKITNNEINQIIISSFSESFASFLSRIKYDYKQCQNFLHQGEFKDNITVITGTGGYPTRLLSEAVKNKSGTVIGSPHGGGLAGADFQDLTWFEFMHCNQFACLSSKEADDYKKHVVPEINMVSFPVFPDIQPSVLDVKDYNYDSFDFSKIKNIMHISMGTWYDEFIYGIPSDLQHLDFQLKVIDYFLQFKDKHYIFKIRPKSRHLGMDYNHLGYYDSKVEYINSPLSEVIDKADLFIAEYIGSSALWEIMTLTEKPIILIKPILPKCYPSFWESMGKRCYVVNQIEDDQNRIAFDVEKLNRLLNSK